MHHDQCEQLNIAAEEAVKAAKLEGLEEGLRMYAWWKDGVEYVGTCGRTLADALRDVRKEHEEKG